MAWVQLGMNSARMTIGVVRALGWPQGSRGLCSGGNTLSPTYLPAEAGEPWTNGGRGLKAGCQFVYGLKGQGAHSRKGLLSGSGAAAALPVKFRQSTGGHF